MNTKNGAHHLFFFLVIRPALNRVLIVVVVISAVSYTAIRSEPETFEILS